MDDNKKSKEQLIKEIAELRLINSSLKLQAAQGQKSESVIAELQSRTEVLKSKEEEYRLMHLNAAIGIGYYTPDGVVISYNNIAAKHMNGLPEDFTGKSIFDIFPKQEAELYLERIKKAALSDESLVYEDKVPLHLGNKYFISTFSRIIDSKNKIRGIQIFSHDITDRKQVESKLKSSEERLKIIFDYAPDAYFLTDLRGTFVDGNIAAEKLLGQNKNELIGKNYMKLNLLSIKQLPKAARLLIKNSLGQATGPDEFELNLKDRSKITVEILTYPVKIKGQPLVLGIARNITERRKVEKELSESLGKNLETSKLLNAVLDAIPDIIGIQNNNHEVIRYNKAGYDFLQQTPEGVSGKKCYSLIGRETKCSICSTADCYVSKKTELHQQFFPEYNIWFDMRSYPILNEKGEIHYVIEHLRDISDIKHIESELIRSKEKAEESDRLKSVFLANMSHEIRTPMNGILGFAELLKNPMLSGEEMQEYISIIRKSGNRMLNIINDLIDVSKIESGQMRVFISECNINEQTSFLHNFFKPDADQKGLKFFYKNSLSDHKAIIKTDKDKIFSILSNLIKNAIKFTNEGSIEIGYQKKGDLIEFYVKDTGIGITIEQRETIFERFRQGNEFLNRSYEGAGLGLYITKTYVEMLGGKIWVESDISNYRGNGGSIFYFTIPYNSEAVKSDNYRNPDPGDGEDHVLENLKVIIAEDDDASALLISRMIGKISKEVLIARNGLEAVEAYLNNPDTGLVLMDIKMAEMDGYEATRQIRQLNRNIVIIAQTAYAQTGDKEMAIKAGCNDYISKPINPDEFHSLIKKHFQNRKTDK
ncbi:MAG: PAS domain S-box protein [Bacteroidales bacterium]|nr:PAS domain S-box protein [Bacteroidales bacterium]